MSTTWNAALYDDKHAFVWKKAADLLELLAPQPGERILDLGCGTGHLTAQIAAADAVVTGIDSAPAMIEQARAAYPGLHFEVADARDFAFPEPFDAVFSNAVLHWVPDAERVAACIARALRPGGRFIAEFGGHGNVRTIVAALEETSRQFLGAALRSPWYYPSIAQYAAILEAHGLEPRQAQLFDRPTKLEGDEGMRHWIEMFGQHWLQRIATDQREEFMTRVESALRARLYRNGAWYADYRRLRIVAVKEDLG